MPLRKGDNVTAPCSQRLQPRAPPETPCRWAHPPRALPLTTGTVHVWLAHLDAPPAAPTLSLAEWRRAERLRRPLDRARFVARRTQLRALLSGYVRRPPQLLELGVGPCGKPFLAGSALHFNLSHAGGLALYAFADRPLGVDLERVRADLPLAEMLPHAFTPAEQRAFYAAPADARANLFFRLWTRREAQLKARGTGFLDGAAGTPAEDTPSPAGVRTIYPHPGFVAALASEGTTCAFWRCA